MYQFFVKLFCPNRFRGIELVLRIQVTDIIFLGLSLGKIVAPDAAYVYSHWRLNTRMPLYSNTPHGCS